MSLEKSKSNEVNNRNVFIKQENEDFNINNSQENNLLLKPVAIKQKIYNNPQSNNKFSSVSVIYSSNQQQNQYLNNINNINSINKNNYINKKEFENIKHKNNEIQNLNNNEKGAFSLLKNYENKKINNNNNNNNSYIKNELGEQNNKIHCTCKKTRCVKKYCECYSNKVFCYNCKCENCENKPNFINDNIKDNDTMNNNKKENEEEINEDKYNNTINNKQNNETINDDMNDSNSKKLIICTCSKSGCNKNYCECFKAKVKCNNKCRCIKCLNKPEDSIPLDETKIISKSTSNPITNNLLNSETNSNNVNNFTVHRISVNINKVQTLINTEKLDYFDSNKFLSKKRNDS